MLVPEDLTEMLNRKKALFLYFNLCLSYLFLTNNINCHTIFFPQKNTVTLKNKTICLDIFLEKETGILCKFLGQL
jgi:hypothetical protein